MEPREIFHDKRKLFSMEDLLPECLSDTGKKRKKNVSWNSEGSFMR